MDKTKKGKIIFLNGVTSSGKTSIGEEMQRSREHFLHVVANDLFEETIGEEYLREDYWKYLSEAIIMMYHTARMYSDFGKDIIIDGIIVERPEIAPHYQRICDIFEGYPLSIIQVSCPLDVCRLRNIERGDRYEMQSHEQAELMAKDIEYCFRVDTNLYSPAECADMILRKVYSL